MSSSPCLIFSLQEHCCWRSLERLAGSIELFPLRIGWGIADPMRFSHFILYLAAVGFCCCASHRCGHLCVSIMTQGSSPNGLFLSSRLFYSCSYLLLVCCMVLLMAGSIERFDVTIGWALVIPMGSSCFILYFAAIIFVGNQIFIQRLGLFECSFDTMYAV